MNLVNLYQLSLFPILIFLDVSQKLRHSGDPTAVKIRLIQVLQVLLLDVD